MHSVQSYTQMYAFACTCTAVYAIHALTCMQCWAQVSSKVLKYKCFYENGSWVQILSTKQKMYLRTRNSNALSTYLKVLKQIFLNH